MERTQNEIERAQSVAPTGPSGKAPAFASRRDSGGWFLLALLVGLALTAGIDYCWNRSAAENASPFMPPGHFGALAWTFGLWTMVLISWRNRRLIAAKDRQLQELNALLEHTAEGLSQLDAAGFYVMTNTAYAGMFGYRPEEMAGKLWESDIPPAERETVQAAYEEMLTQGRAETETQGIRRDGSLFAMQMTMVALYDEAGNFTGHHRMMKDTSERQAFQDQITHQAFHDALTGLANRALLLDQLHLAQEKAKREKRLVAVAFLDLDNLKRINDSLGHEVGDQLLIAVAARLTQCVRPGDTVARLSGDSFIVLMDSLRSLEDAINIVERIQEVFRAPVSLEEKEIFAAASIGLACSNNDSDQLEDLLRDADTAMYQAKANGKGGYALFDPSMNCRVVEWMELETDLRFAQERGELRVHYQPLIDLKTGHIAGVEALIRWEHPTRGLISPGKFVPVAEETGMIVPIGYWILEEACRQTVEWKQAYPDHGDFTVNVNLSGKQLQRSDVVARVREVLDKTGLSPTSLKLEITESVIMSDMEDIVAKLQQLKMLGVKLALDDFGTGYSSMANLGAFPVDTIKIDRSFISRLTEYPTASSIVAAIIMLARALNMDVTGEGVENAEQVTHLQGLGCDIAQGFYFARPLTATSVGETMATGSSVQMAVHDDAERELIEHLLLIDHLLKVA